MKKLKSQIKIQKYFLPFIFAFLSFIFGSPQPCMGKLNSNLPTIR